ncbi:chemotaxis protein [Christensenella intestinihominis]|uniref:chemotaxis protein n=1 Tax=Christensenella intestinihominis TaxID=1851429 RepID=UPI00083557DE|nr:chemotaxis protein [Christensenella intestinihominis]
MNPGNKQEILLESGTNEIEIMEFTISHNTFGINVAKIREIMNPMDVKRMPHVHPAVEGVFKPRDILITVINLPKYLDMESEHDNSKDLLIVANFNNMHIAFRVDTVVGIDRISWKDIEKPDKTIYGGEEGIVTGLAQFEDRLITVLDFEKIVADIAPETGIQLSEIDELGKRDQNDQPILVVEDSVLLSAMILQALHKAGYTNTVKKDNGQEAWDYLTALKRECDEEGIPVTEKTACIITDIEMPQMDGHHLTKLIKEDGTLKKIPIIVFSSLINDEMRIKGKEVGADEQLSKPEIGRLVTVVDNLLEKFSLKMPGE